MGDLVNLNRVRKRTTKEREDKRAAANRLKFGRTRAERELEKKQTGRLRQHLDGHERDPGDAP